jgi:hypothetical protein
MFETATPASLEAGAFFMNGKMRRTPIMIIPAIIKGCLHTTKSKAA